MTKRTSNTDLYGSAGLLLGLTLLYFVQRQSARWSDGRAIVQMVDAGRWSYHHVLYLPVARLSAAAGALLGIGTEPALHLLSAAASALAVALFHLAVRSLAVDRVTAFLAALLLASAPGVWFFATCVEVHALQLAFAGGALLWFARTVESERPSAVPPALFLGGLFGSHMTGALWGPALLLALFRGKGNGKTGWRRPRHLVPGVVAAALAPAAWFYATGGRGTGSGHVLLGLRELLASWRPALLWREVLAPAGVLYALMAIGLASRDEARPRVPALAPTALLFASFLPFAFTLHIAERGAYFLSLLPVAAAFSCLALQALGRWRVLAGLLLVAGQTAWAVHEVREWELHYPGWEWAEVLFEETGGEGLVLALDRAEWEAVVCHSELQALSLKARRTRENMESMQRAAFRAVERTLSAGRPVAITRTLRECEFPEVREYVSELVTRFGEPRPGRRPEYLFFPPRVTGR